MEQKFLHVVKTELPYYLGNGLVDVLKSLSWHLTSHEGNKCGEWIGFCIILEDVHVMGEPVGAKMFCYCRGVIHERGDGVNTKDKTEIGILEAVFFWGDCPDVVLDIINASGVLEPPVGDDAVPSCQHSCSPSDYCVGGKCDVMGCYKRKL
jgi:hypothetical protein